MKTRVTSTSVVARRRGEVACMWCGNPEGTRFVCYEEGTVLEDKHVDLCVTCSRNLRDGITRARIVMHETGRLTVTGLTPTQETALCKMAEEGEGFGRTSHLANEFFPQRPYVHSLVARTLRDAGLVRLVPNTTFVEVSVKGHEFVGRIRAEDAG